VPFYSVNIEKVNIEKRTGQSFMTGFLRQTFIIVLS